MTDLEPCLLCCDTALGEADLLILMLSEDVDSLDPNLAAVRMRIAALRHEVERLRGLSTIPTRRKIHPDWIDLSSNGSPWAVPGSDQLGESQAGGA